MDADAAPHDRTPRRGPFALAGVLATGAGLGLGHLAAAFAGPASSPILAVSSRAIDLTPTPLKDWAVATFGTADKVVLVGGAVLMTLGLGALVGLLARRSVTLALVVGAALAAIPLVSAAIDPGRSALWPIPALVALIVGAEALWLLTRDDRLPADAASRRHWLRLGASIGGIGALGGLTGEALTTGGPGVRTPAAPRVTLPPRTLKPRPVGLDAQLPGLSPFVTPASDLFRIDTALSVPTLDAATWRLSIHGLVDRQVSLGWDDLLTLDTVERPVTLACVSNEVGGGLIGSGLWLGVRTADLLAQTGVRAGADMVLSTSADGFTVSTPLAALLDDRDALVAYGLNGEALPFEHGYPARLITPGLYGFVGATKWLVSLQVTTFDAVQAYWTQRGWAAEAPMKLGSRIEVPRSNARIAPGPVKVGGTAWAPRVGVGGVQVRVDTGPWTTVTLGPEAGLDFWRQWLWTWDASPGEHQLQVRVLDASGRPQDETVAAPFPDGASGLHTIRVSVG